MSTTSHHKYVAARAAQVGAARTQRPLVYHPPAQRGTIFGRFLRRFTLLALALVSLFILLLAAYKFWVDSDALTVTYNYDNPTIPARHAAIVFGAGLTAGGGPSPMLYDRVAAAADLYLNNKVEKLLMTGDNSTVTHNEVEAMRKTAVQLGVPDEDIVLDYAGFNTWDSCYRAREIFGLTSATLVTQRFHLPRALHTCSYLGVRSIGVAADRQPYNTEYNELREYIALAGTAARIVTNDKPHFLGEKVDIDEPQER